MIAGLIVGNAGLIAAWSNRPQAVTAWSRPVSLQVWTDKYQGDANRGMLETGCTGRERNSFPLVSPFQFKLPATHDAKNWTERTGPSDMNDERIYFSLFLSERGHHIIRRGEVKEGL